MELKTASCAREGLYITAPDPPILGKLHPSRVLADVSSEALAK